MNVFLGAVPQVEDTSFSTLCSGQATRRSLAARSAPVFPAPSCWSASPSLVVSVFLRCARIRPRTPTRPQPPAQMRTAVAGVGHELGDLM